MVIYRYLIFNALLFLLFSISGLHAQTTLTGCVTDQSNTPLPFATVYLSNTTIGTLANENGIYTLKIPRNGEYDLVSSCIGFATNTRTIRAEGANLTINIKLKANVILIDEVTVSAKDKNRVKNYSQFFRLFIGESILAQSCRILNDEDLRLYHDDEDNIVKGFSTKPLRIENKALGYLITYDLTDFSYNQKSKILKFSGGQYFQSLPGTSKQIVKWERNRLKTYYGSKIHFFRTLGSDLPEREGYKIYECSIDPKTDETSIGKPLQAKDIRVSADKSFSTFFYPKPLLVSYTENHAELFADAFGYQPTEYKSTIVFSKPLKVYQNGRFDNPYAIFWGGKMAGERISDMVPFDFLPEAKVPEEPVMPKFATEIDQYLNFQQYSTGKEQVFVHTDRNRYAPGDTVYFQAYIRNRFTGDFTTSSLAFYAMLYNSQKERIDSSRFRIENSRSSGWMAIPANAANGKYHLVAFSAMMQNFNPEDAFHMDIEVQGMIDQPTKDDHDATDEKHMTANNPEKNTSSSNDIQDIELRFLPEGGTTIAGLEQRIGFNATNRKGEPVKINGELMNADGKIIDTIHSGTYGPGMFVCTPERGMYVKLSNDGFENKKFPLPAPATSGICLSVHPINNRSFAVEIQSGNYTGDSAFISVSSNMNQFYSQDFRLNKKQRFVVDTDQLPSGIAQITVFDKQKRPVAERLFAINTDKHLKYKIQTDRTNYSPDMDTELSVSVSDGMGNPAEGVFSIAAIDSLSGQTANLFTPGIEYSLTYHPYLLKNLPAQVLAKGIENLSPEDRDLLFMVYGWKKYNWDFSLIKKVNPMDLINYNVMNLKIRFASKNKKSDRKLDLFSLEGSSIMHLATDKSGEITLPLDSLPENTRSVIMMPLQNDQNKVTEAKITVPSNPGYYKSDKLLSAGPMLPIAANNPFPTYSESKPFLSDTIIALKGITVSAKKKNPIEYHDKYEKFYSNENVKSLDGISLSESTNLSTALYKITNVDIIGSKVYLRVKTSFFLPRVPALFVLDGLPLFADDAFEQVKKILPSEIASLTVLKGSQGWAMYGEKAKGGVIFVNTKANNPGKENLKSEMRTNNSLNQILLPIAIYRSTIEFYNPTREEVDRDPQIQSSPTVFWKSEIYYDGKQPVKIKYPNLKSLTREGKVIITINGVSSGNMTGTGRASYRVQEEKAQ